MLDWLFRRKEWKRRRELCVDERKALLALKRIAEVHVREWKSPIRDFTLLQNDIRLMSDLVQQIDSIHGELGAPPDDWLTKQYALTGRYYE